MTMSHVVNLLQPNGYRIAEVRGRTASVGSRQTERVLGNEVQCHLATDRCAA